MAYNNGLLLPLCRMQNGNCEASLFRRLRVSSSGGVSIGVASNSLLERGILTILAVGKAVSGELTEGVAAAILGFI